MKKRGRKFLYLIKYKLSPRNLKTLLFVRVGKKWREKTVNSLGSEPRNFAKQCWILGTQSRYLVFAILWVLKATSYHFLLLIFEVLLELEAKTGS